MTRVLSAGLPALAMLMLVDPAQAQETGHNVKPILDLRLRAEEVDQDGLDSTLALTLAGRFGLDAKFTNGWGALIEGEAVGHLTSDFSDTVDTVPGKAVIADPEAFELNRLQISWKGEEANATLGRQRIIFDDARFVGNVGFRQNEQTFDAVRFGFPASGMSVWTMYISTRCSAFLATRALRGSSKAIPILCMPAVRPQSATLC